MEDRRISFSVPETARRHTAVLSQLGNRKRDQIPNASRRECNNMDLLDSNAREARLEIRIWATCGLIVNS